MKIGKNVIPKVGETLWLYDVFRSTALEITKLKVIRFIQETCKFYKIAWLDRLMLWHCANPLPSESA